MTVLGRWWWGLGAGGQVRDNEDKWRSFGREGVNSSDFKAPCSVAIRDLDTVGVADSENNRVPRAQPGPAR